MSDPYKVLDVPHNADEAAIRQRYLELVRQFPPDRFPERFAEVRAAYDDLRDPVTRLKNQIFEFNDSESIEDAIADVRSRIRAARIPVETLLSLGDD
jgi:curved DNA-binding protein CbpA